MGLFITKPLFLLCLYILLSSCKDNEHYKKELSSQNHATAILEAAYKLGEQKDTSAIKPLLTNILDPRMSTNLKYKGMTVCYGRLVALRKITGASPSWKIAQFDQDTAAVNFYLTWAFTKGIVQNRNDIDIEYHD
ncbi:MAG TPA: hypothetical protein VMR70_02660 [Flavisolibacter sp.]|nr:hypothetical protein [Flavisolibacter sp.]